VALPRADREARGLSKLEFARPASRQANWSVIPFRPKKPVFRRGQRGSHFPFPWSDRPTAGQFRPAIFSSPARPSDRAGDRLYLICCAGPEKGRSGLGSLFSSDYEPSRAPDPHLLGDFLSVLRRENHARRPLPEKYTGRGRWMDTEQSDSRLSDIRHSSPIMRPKKPATLSALDSIVSGGRARHSGGGRVNGSSASSPAERGGIFFREKKVLPLPA